jgi:hypothetical protein
MAVIVHKGARSRQRLRIVAAAAPANPFDRNKSGAPGGSLPFDERIPPELAARAERVLGASFDRRLGERALRDLVEAAERGGAP